MLRCLRKTARAEQYPVVCAEIAHACCSICKAITPITTETDFENGGKYVLVHANTSDGFANVLV